MPDELYKVEIRGQLAGQYRENVMYWKIAGATSDTPYVNAESLLAFIDSTVKPKWLLTLPDDYILEAILARRVKPTTGAYAAVDYQPLSTPGTRTGPAVSESLCPCITLIPPMGVKSGGKIFLPAVAKTDINLNVPIAGYLTAITNLMNTMITGGSAAGGTATIAIYSRKLDTYSLVSSYHLSPVLGYQRRRAHPVGS